MSSFAIFVVSFKFIEGYMNPLNFLWQKSVDLIHADSWILNTVLALEYTFVLFGMELFAWSVLEWLMLQQRMLPSEMSAIFVAHLAPYTWVLCYFCILYNVQ